MLRVGLGCMRLATEAARDDARAIATIRAAADAGIVWFDTARAYAHEGGGPHGERLLREALAGHADARIVTKCGMARPEGRWQPDGRARTILADARESCAALGRPADLLLLHAPDPEVPLATSIRALVRAREEGLARAIGLSNATRGQLDAWPPDVTIGGVEVALGAYADTAARGGVLAWCRTRGVPLFAHSPFGGVARSARVLRDPVLARIAARRSPPIPPACVLLAYLLALDPLVVPLPGARRPETAVSAARSEEIVLDARDLEELDARFPGLAFARRGPRRAFPPRATASSREVVLVMGLAGAGKSRLTEDYAARGYARLNRDTLGGTLRGIAQRLDERLGHGVEKLVLDNTYVTRASRADVVRVAERHDAVVRCVWLDTPILDAQRNIVGRMLDRHGALLGGVDLVARARRDPNLFGPTTIYRMQRDLEPPAADEGFASIEVLPFVRAPDPRAASAGIVLPLDRVLRLRGGAPAALREDAAEPLARARRILGERRQPEPWPVLVVGQREGADEAWEARARDVLGPLGSVDLGVCVHAGSGPPACWCRPPLPGLWLAFARRRGADAARSVLVAEGPSFVTWAKNVGLTVVG